MAHAQPPAMLSSRPCLQYQLSEVLAGQVWRVSCRPLHSIMSQPPDAFRVWVQCGLEDWELSKIRVNLLQKADASDLLERLSMLQPLSSNHQSTERNKLQGLFSRNSHHRASLQRCATLACSQRASPKRQQAAALWQLAGSTMALFKAGAFS